MPRRNAIVRRPAFAIARRASYGGGILRAVTKAANSAAVKTLTRKARAAGVKPSWRRKLLSDNQARRASRTVVSGDFDAPGNDLSVSRAKVGRFRRPTVSRVNRLIHAMLSTNVYRFQKISQYDTNVGALTLAQFYNQTTGYEHLPLHIYDLTSFPNYTTTGTTPGKAYSWNSALSIADVVRHSIPGQKPDGTDDASGFWWQTNGKQGYPNSPVAQHNWSDIRLSLYSARKRTTKFMVTFFRVKDESANPFHAGSTNTDLKQLVEWFVRPNIYSNIQTYETKVKRKLQIVKQFTYYVPGSTTTDVDQTVGKIKEARIFMRHDRVYKMDWMETADAGLPHTLQDGKDYTTMVGNQDHPWHGSRLFMAITAFSPEKGTFTTEFPTADATRDPSYDIIIRNSFTTP